MKKYILFMAAVFAVFSLKAQQTFILKGEIKGKETGILKLRYNQPDGKPVQDSTAITAGRFEFKGTLTEPVMAYIMGDVKRLSMDEPNFGTLFLAPGALKLVLTEGQFKSLQLTGSKPHDEYVLLEQKKAPIAEETKPILALLQKASEAYVQAKKENRPDAQQDVLREKAAEIRDQLEPANLKRDKIDLDFISHNPNSYYAAYLLSFKISGLKLADAKKYYDAFTPLVKASSYGKKMLKEVQSLQSGSPGSTAVGFAKKDINGQDLSLADYKGKKYVLLDFWASWCVPCRKGNPHLLSLYSKYKDKGLEIIGVADDDSAQQAWKRAVEQDKIGVWKHVLRGLKRTSTGYDRSEDTSEGFGIHSLPTKILIDKNGMIIGRYGGGGDSDEEMDKKLASIFN
ncbi:TlpA disulfide reductase family protein [Pedobacter psychrodurus]|uniref:TlpA disulfide reductase family protein n=1 Tax=Pedobacter psychrodurus TaxID=2530456 RepID=UPI00292F9D34|nr:TlpA disulfide reductase family protein [Pedobacter psychrodurus]